MKVLIIIPAYNEQESIGRVVDQLRARLDERFSYVVVNDGSKDDTLQVLSDGGCSYLNLPINLGIGGGMQAGYQYALAGGFDAAIQLDGDGQHDPAYLDALLAPLEAGEADLVIGSRFLDKQGFQSTRLWRLGIRLISGTIRLLCGVRVQDATSGFRACNRRLIAFFARNYADDYPEPECIIAAARQGFRIREIPVVMRERQGGASSISGFKSVQYMAKVELALLLHAFRRKES